MANKSMNYFEHFLFNFSSSASGGGLKRLLAYSDWFNNNGGAQFIVHSNLRGTWISLKGINIIM